MPRPAKGPRLALKGRGPSALWIIRDGDRRIATGCRAGDRAGAEIALADYLRAIHTPPRSQRDPAAIPLADVIGIYLTDVVAGQPEPDQRRRAAARAERLLTWWGARTLADVTGATCRAYAAQRGNAGGARRDLQDLSAAIQHHHREGMHREHVRVWLPPRGAPRERWLSRSEIARLVWAAWSYRAAMPIPARWRGDNAPPGTRRPAMHLARAILMAYYTGSRPGDVLRASFVRGPGRSWVDLAGGVFHRLPEGKAPTRKRQPPCVLGVRILSHLRRWQRVAGASYVVEWEGLPVRSVKTAWAGAIARAGLAGPVPPYTLRHSRATHLLRAGISTWDVAQALGTSEAMVRAHYGHHCPDGQARAANAR